ncbi:MAG: hypothetical protein QOH31_4510 [Verrucomicrobiota bacterium]
MIGEAAGGSSAATSRADYRQQSTTSTLPSLSSFPGDQAFRLLYVALIVSSTFGVLAFGVPPFATRSPLTSPLTRSRRSLYSHCPCVFSCARCRTALIMGQLLTPVSLPRRFIPLESLPRPAIPPPFDFARECQLISYVFRPNIPTQR